MKKLLCSAAVVGLLALPATATAQVDVTPMAAFADDVDFGIGAGFAFPLESLDEAIEGAVNFTFFFPDGFDYWEIEALLRYLIEIDNPDIVPYVTAGLGIGRFSFDVPDIGIPGFDIGDQTELALKVGGGAKFNASSNLVPFGEIIVALGDLPDFMLRGGVSFRVGG